MANPLDPGNSEHSRLSPGESMTYTGTSARGNSKTVTIHRTTRPYVEDLADAYNAALSEDARRRGLAWQVTHNGELKLDFTPAEMARNTKRIEERKETDRARFVHRQFNPVV